MDTIFAGLTEGLKCFYVSGYSSRDIVELRTEENDEK